MFQHATRLLVDRQDVVTAGLGIDRRQALRDIRTSAETAELVLRNRGKLERSDAAFISCTNLKSMDQLTRLEAELGVSVVSSNAATLWLGLRRRGVSTAHLPLGQLNELDSA